jgi:hypothetical protein
MRWLERSLEGASLAVLAAATLSACVFGSGDDSLDCVTGEQAARPDRAAGELVAQQEFATVAEGEAFICLDVPEVHAEGWEVSGVNALRWDPIDAYEAGAYLSADRRPRYLELAYANEEVDEGRGWILNLRALPLGLANSISCEELHALPNGPFPDSGEAIATELTVGGAEATHWVWLAPEGVAPSMLTCWERDGLTFTAGGAYAENIEVERELVPVFESIE